MYSLKITVLSTTNMTGHVPKFGQKHPASVTTNTVIFLVRFRHKNHLISVTKKKVLLENIQRYHTEMQHHPLHL